jgi:ATP/maltotriose-dependent transcriptional regulator MalT
LYSSSLLPEADAAGQRIRAGRDISEAHRVWVAAFLPPGPPARQERHPETLTHAETRVLRYLPTNLSASEIAGELYLSVNTVKTHQRHLYQKLGARSRTEAVGQARALGLLASSRRMELISGGLPLAAGRVRRRSR